MFFLILLLSYVVNISNGQNLKLPEFKRFESNNHNTEHWKENPFASVVVPDGWKVVSGGSEVSFNRPGQMMQSSVPIINGAEVPIGWSVSSTYHIYKALGMVKAFAIAFYDPNDEWDVKVVSSTSTKEELPTAVAILPEGYSLVGGGARTHFNCFGTLITSSRPVYGGWEVQGKYHLKKDTGSVESFAIGLRHRLWSLETVSTQIKHDTSRTHQHPKLCITASHGMEFIGVGAYVERDAKRGNLLVDYYVTADKSEACGYAKDHLTPDFEQLTVYGIEVRSDGSIDTSENTTPDLTLRRFESKAIQDQSPSENPSASVQMPHGFKVVSGGAILHYHGAGELLYSSEPQLNSNEVPIGWSVRGRYHIHKDKGEIQAFANAIYDPADEWDVKVVSSISTTASHPATVATLPADYTLLGGGGKVHFRGKGSMLVSCRPVGSHGWEAAAKDHLVGDKGEVQAFAIGIKNKIDVQRKIETVTLMETSGTAAHPSQCMFASNGQVFSSVGAAVSKGGAGNMLVNMFVVRNGTEVCSSAKDHLVSDPQQITVFGIQVKNAVYKL